MSIEFSKYDYLFNIGKKLELLSQPFHPIDKYNAKNILKGAVVNITKAAMWSAAIFHVFDAGFRHSVRNLLQLPLHPLAPLAVLVSTLGLGILLQGLGESYAVSNSHKPHRRHNPPAEAIRNSHFKMNKVKVQIPKNFSFAKFKNFLLQKAEPKKKKLFEETVLKKKELFTKTYPGKSLYYRKMTLPMKKFVQLTKDNTTTSKLKVDVTPDWYDYTDEKNFYVNFANAERPGGGYRGKGNIMEEVMFEEIPTYPLLDYLVRESKELILPTLSGNAFPDDEAAPYIFQNVRRHVKTDPSLYGSGYTKVKTKELSKYIDIPDQPSPRFHVIALAAQRWTDDDNKRYDMDSLLYHLQAAYLGFFGAKKTHEEMGYQKPQPTVHTGAWGCGAFGNSEKMIVSIQILAARMSGVNLMLHGIDYKGNPGYTEKMVREQEKFIDGMLNNKQSPYQILKELIRKQSSDKLIRPK